MAFIEQETVNRILDTADIVEVVSDFVKLKRRGANYVGLCPFHSERTPSFSVSKAKGLCKCFSCGKGGSAVGFIMEIEQINYGEALRYLARKYNIEIKEKELTDEEREAASERETLFAVNKFALDYFEKTLHDTPQGRAIGEAYFLERGINEEAMRRFHLGYSPDRGDSFMNEALKQGYTIENMSTVGVVARKENGEYYDRFRGRVIYPVFSLSGKVVAFGGRVLRNDRKNIAKYVNSPESSIYSKSKELYGLYQARRSIVKEDKCILVEGYMDVISMSQLGIENIVSSSGTSLTQGQIRLIHRFTENVTVIYDSDPAGIKASLRGIDLLLADGMSIKVLLLPDGEDPDSFAQSHTLEEVKEYIARNEQDFIRFKADILLRDAADDPVKRARVIGDIVNSIACIPDPIARSVYINECSRLLNIDEKVLKLEVDKRQAANALKAEGDARQTQQEQEGTKTTDEVQAAGLVIPAVDKTITASQAVSRARQHLAQCERDLLTYILKYGMVTMQGDNVEGTAIDEFTVLECVDEELSADCIEFSVSSYIEVYNEAMRLLEEEWPGEKERIAMKVEEALEEELRKGYDTIKVAATGLSQIQRLEKELEEKLAGRRIELLHELSTNYLSRRMASCENDSIRRLASDLASDRHQLSKVHTRYGRIDSELDRLGDIVPRAILNLKDAHLGLREENYRQELRALDPHDPDYAAESLRLMTLIAQTSQLRSQTSTMLDRVIRPR